MKIKEIIKKAIIDQLGQVEFAVEHPADEKMGDFACNAAMVLAKSMGKNPRELAGEIVEKLKQNNELGKVVDLDKIEIAGPGFINFWLKRKYLLDEMDCRSSSTRFAMTEDRWAAGKVFEVEHTSPNPNKAMHIGHLRNNVTGMAMASLFEAGGARVIRDCVDNNRGIAIAKLMWGYLKFAKRDKKEIDDINYWYDHQDEWLVPEELNKKPDVFVDELYVKGSEDYKASKDVEEKVKKMVVDWEAEDKTNRELWKKVLSYSYQGQEFTLKRLGSKWDKVWKESDHYKKGKEYVKRGLLAGIFKKLEDGAILTDLESFGITDTIVQKSDGTSLYITQDLALTELRKKEFEADKIYWVIGPEQSLGMKQMFAVCEQLGIGKMSDFVHLPYGYMSLKGQGKMSSRMGNVVYIDQLLDIVKERVMEKIADRDFSEEEKINVAAVKYSILKVGRMTDMSFDVDTSISFDGDSAPYLNYVYVRTQSLLKKVENWNKEASVSVEELSVEEVSLLRWIYRFNETVERAGVDLAPNLICSYLLELSQRFNVFYGKHTVLGDESKKDFRLKLASVTGNLIKNGLGLLCIEVIEKM